MSHCPANSLPFDRTPVRPFAVGAELVLVILIIVLLLTQHSGVT